MLVVGEHAGKHIANFSMQFQSEFVALLSRRFGTKRVKANNVYQEHIRDKSHLHMNSTRWVTLTEFVKHLGRTGVARVDETEKGWFIAWIDNSPKALAKQEAALKKERLTTSDEQRERLLIAEQIERASVATDPSGTETDPSAPTAGLKRSEDAEKVVLSLSIKPVATATLPTESSSASVAPLKMNPLRAPTTNPLKRPNVFKSSPLASSAASTTSSSTDKSKKRPLSAVESIIYEEEERKKRRMEREGGMP